MTTLAIEFLDQIASEGRQAFSVEEARSRLKRSPQATANLICRLSRDGWVERARRGTYLIHVLGELGIPAASGDRLGTAIAAAVADRVARLAYGSALQEYDLLTRPQKGIQIAVDRRLFVRQLSGRPFQSFVEDKDDLKLGAEPFGPVMISNIGRALLESAQRPRLVGGIATVAEALARARRLDVCQLIRLASELGFTSGLRRLIALDRGLSLNRLEGSAIPPSNKRAIPLDPDDPRRTGPLDGAAKVRWPGPIDELRNVVQQ